MVDGPWPIVGFFRWSTVGLPVYNKRVIELRNVQKVLNGKTVLNIPELTVGAGEIAGIFGPEGSGGDVLFALLTGRMRPTLGTVRAAGLDPLREREAFSRKAGIVFHDDALYKNLSTAANLEFHANLYGVPKARTAEVLDQVGLADQAAVQADDLPSGLKRRLAFGRAILHRPQGAHPAGTVRPVRRGDDHPAWKPAAPPGGGGRRRSSSWPALRRGWRNSARGDIEIQQGRISEMRDAPGEAAAPDLPAAGENRG